jgi:hypothetical protein
MTCFRRTASVGLPFAGSCTALAALAALPTANYEVHCHCRPAQDKGDYHGDRPTPMQQLTCPQAAHKCSKAGQYKADELLLLEGGLRRIHCASVPAGTGMLEWAVAENANFVTPGKPVSRHSIVRFGAAGAI